jgi:hypothetical protein
MVFRAQISQDQLVGRYESLVNTTVNLGADNTTTLGTLTFQQFKPVDLKVRDCIRRHSPNCNKHWMLMHVEACRRNWRM